MNPFLHVQLAIVSTTVAPIFSDLKPSLENDQQQQQQQQQQYAGELFYYNLNLPLI
jgi:hypothetical protein